MTPEELVEKRTLCKNDPIFLAQSLGYDMEEDPHGEFFRVLGDPNKKKKLGLWPRGTFKSSCVVVEVVRRILNDPDIRILVMQSTIKLTKGWVSEIKSHFDGTNPNSKLPEWFGDFCGPRLGTTDAFTVPARRRKHLKEETVTAASPQAVTTGQHYGLLVFDDLVTANNFRNIEQLDKLWNQYNHFTPLLDPGGEILVTGTRYSHADIYGRILAQKDDTWAITIKECWKPDGTLLFQQRLARDGKRMIGFTDELLQQIRLEMDEEVFVPQYLNKIALGKDQLFPEELLLSAVRATKDNPEYPSSAPTIMYVDLSEGNKDSDNAVVAAGKRDARNRVWLQECVAGKFASAALADIVIVLFLKLRPISVIVEKQPGAVFFVDYVRNVAQQRGLFIPIDVDRTPKGKQKGAKHIRISALPGPLKKKNLFFCAGIADFGAFVEEFTQYPRGRYDDRADCVAMLYQTLTAGSSPQAISLTAAGTASRLPWIVEAVSSSPAQTEAKSSPLGGWFVG
jgi:hypothetical protein